jgi:hypothetical protein
MARVNFPLTVFQDLDGTPLAFGNAVVRISEDVTASSGQICAGMSLSVPLDNTGTMSYVPQVWPNAQLAPTDSTYILEAYTAAGQRVFGPINVTV